MATYQRKRRIRTMGTWSRVKRLNPPEHYPRLVKGNDTMPMLICRDGSARFLTRWEQFLIKMNVTTIQKLDKTKY